MESIVCFLVLAVMFLLAVNRQFLQALMRGERS